MHHHLRRLLVPVDEIRQCQEHVLARGRRDPELAVGVLADLQALELRDVREPRERRQRSDPRRREAVHVGLARADARVRVVLRPEPFVGAHGDRRARAQLAELTGGVSRTGCSTKSMSYSANRSSMRTGLRQRPAGVGIDAQARTGAERVAQRCDHALVLAIVDRHLEIEDVVARREPCLHLRAQIVVLPAREVEEVRHVVAQRAAEQAPERLADGLAADVRERHVDAGPGEVPRAGAELPEAEVERVGAHRVAVPGVAPDRERRHGRHRGLDRGGVGAARRLAPPDQAVVGGDAHEDVRDPVAGHDRAHLAMAVGHVDDDGLDEGDFHSVCSNLVRISLPPARTTNTCSRRMPPKPAA